MHRFKGSDTIRFFFGWQFEDDFLFRFHLTLDINRLLLLFEIFVFGKNWCFFAFFLEDHDLAMELDLVAFDVAATLGVVDVEVDEDIFVWLKLVFLERNHSFHVV